MPLNKKIILIVAGFDPSGKAGILRDISTIVQLNAHAEAVPTAMTIQDSQKCYGFEPLSAPLFNEMLSALLADKKPHAIKIGMVPNIAIADVICGALKNCGAPIVYDPVFATSDGAPLVTHGEEAEIFQMLCQIAAAVTPNMPEAAFLSHIPADAERFAPSAAKILLEMGAKAALIKGGHKAGDIVEDILFAQNGEIFTYSRERISQKPRGTGCALSSALARFLAKDMELSAAFSAAERAMDELLMEGIYAE